MRREWETVVHSDPNGHPYLAPPFKLQGYRKQRRSECESQRWWNTPKKKKWCLPDTAGQVHIWTHGDHDSMHETCTGSNWAKFQHRKGECVRVWGLGIRNWLPSSYSNAQAPKCDSEAPLWPGSVTHFGQEMTEEVPLWQLWVYSLWNSVSMWPDWKSLGRGWETTGNWRSRDRQRLEKLEWCPPSFVSCYPNLWTLQITYR